MQLATRYMALATLVLVQACGVVLYKGSAEASHYPYCTFAVLAVSEFFKCVISIALHLLTRVNATLTALPTARMKDERLSQGTMWRILALAAMYFATNQIAFQVYLHIDPASFDLMKSSSSFVTALMWSTVFGKSVGAMKWIALTQQMCGLVVTQFGACSDSATVPANILAMVLCLVTVSSLTNVWNEHQLKRLPLSVHMQNIVMYAAGTALNLGGHWFVLWTSRPQSHGFFSGYNHATVGVVVYNVCIGYASVAVFKYADSVMKTLAASVTTVLTIVLSWALYGLKLNPVNTSGCTIVVLSVAMYALLSSKDVKQDDD